MKRLAVLSTVLFLAAGAAFAAERGSVPTSEMPEVKEVTGLGNQILETTFYPVINVTRIVDEDRVDPECSPPNYTTFRQLAGKHILTVAPNTGKHFEYTVDRKEKPSTDLMLDKISLRPIPIQDLKTTVNILPAHKRTAKILVFWTVRVVGECPEWQILRKLCNEFFADADFTCRANDVYTYVSVNGKLKDNNPCILQIPEMTNISGQSALYDPTITGTYVITRDDFGGEFPRTVEIQIFWQNKGSLRVTSPNGMRNMIVNVIPYSRADK